jgi:uncharacterized protein
MPELRFIWDQQKDRANRLKHGIAFEEVETVFYDEHARKYSDPDHSESEERFILLGMSRRLRVLVVCHCYRESESIMRIISARRARRNEEKVYWRQEA